MANERVFDEVEGLQVNGITVGGLTSAGVTQGYMDQLEAENGGQGPDAYDEGGQRVDLSLTTTDVLQLIPLLIATPATAFFYGHESGAATFTKATIGTANSKLRMHTASLRVSRGAYAQMTLDGTVAGNGTEEFEAICVYADGQSAPTLSYPLMIWKPTALAHGALSVYHPMDLSLRLTPRLLTRYGDTDVGLTALDVAGWNAAVEITVHDSGKYSTSSHEVCTQLLVAGIADLVVDLEGVGQTPDKVLTLRNCKFRQRRKNTQRGDTGHTVSGILQWRDPLTPWTVRTLDHETPATRLVDIANA